MSRSVLSPTRMNRRPSFVPPLQISSLSNRSNIVHLGGIDSPQLSPILPHGSVPTSTSDRIASIINTPVLLTDVERMVQDSLVQNSEFALHRDSIMAQLEYELDHASNHFTKQPLPDDDILCNNEANRQANVLACSDPDHYSQYRYDDTQTTECTDEKGFIQSISSRNIPELVGWLKDNGKIFFDTTLDDVITGTSFDNWNWALVENEMTSNPAGEYYLNMVAVEDIYEFGTKHVFLGNQMSIFAAGEMQIDRTNNIVRYNFNSSNIADIDAKLPVQVRVYKIFQSMLPFGYTMINDQLNMQLSNITGVSYTPKYFSFYRTKACMSDAKVDTLNRWLKQHKRSFDPNRQIDIKKIYKRLTHKLEKMGYINLRYLGQGAFGRVYDATEDKTGRRVAVKVSSQISLTEIDGGGRLEHPNILHAKGFGLHPVRGGQPGTLEQIIVMPKLRPFSILLVTSGLDAIRICYEIASGISFLHDNDFYHCDLKPDNLLVHPTTNMTIIGDLNLLGDANAPAMACGHIGWIAPENITHYNPDVIYGVDGKKNDVFTLGLLFAYMLSGGLMLVPHLDTEVATYHDIVDDPETTVTNFMNGPTLDWMDNDIGPGTKDAWTKLITNMILPNVDKRYTIQDVFASNVFAEASYEVPLPGRVLASMDHSYPITPSGLNYSCFAALVDRAFEHLKFYPACIFFMFHVYANCLSPNFAHIFPTAFNAQQRAEHAAFFAAKITGKYYSISEVNTVVNDLVSMFGQCTRETYAHMLVGYLRQVKGHIRVVNIFDKATSLAEVEWALEWILKVCIGEKPYKDPIRCHYEYCTQIETAGQRMNRLPKKSALRAGLLTNVKNNIIPEIERKAGSFTP